MDNIDSSENIEIKKEDKSIEQLEEELLVQEQKLEQLERQKAEREGYEYEKKDNNQNDDKMQQKIQLIAQSHDYIMGQQQNILNENIKLKENVKELLDFIEFQDLKFDKIVSQRDQLSQQLRQLRQVWKLFDAEKEDDCEDLHFFRHLLKRDYQ